MKLTPVNAAWHAMCHACPSLLEILSVRSFQTLPMAKTNIRVLIPLGNPWCSLGSELTLGPAVQSRQSAALRQRPRFPAHAGDISQEAPQHTASSRRHREQGSRASGSSLPCTSLRAAHWCLLEEELGSGMRGFSQGDLNH